MLNSLVKWPLLCGGGLQGGGYRLLLLRGPRDIAISGWTFAIGHGRKGARFFILCVVKRN